MSLNWYGCDKWFGDRDPHDKGYRGQRYEVRADEDGKEFVLGWTNSKNGDPFIEMIKMNISVIGPSLETALARLVIKLKESK